MNLSRHNRIRQAMLWEEYREYVHNTPMEPSERKLLYSWVQAGNSVYDNPGSKYLIDQYPPQEYLNVLRTDQELDRLFVGRTLEEKERYLRQYMGYDNPSSTSSAPFSALEDHVRSLEHDLFFLWEYLSSEQLWSEAKEYLDEHSDDPIPFGWK